MSATGIAQIIGLLLEGIQLTTAAIDLAQRAKALNAKQRALFAQMKKDGEVSVAIQQQVEDAFNQLEAAGFEFGKPLPAPPPAVPAVWPPA